MFKSQQDSSFQALIRQSGANDDEPWLVYADWLEEQGDPRCELYRQRRYTVMLPGEIPLEFMLIPPGTVW